MATVPTYASLHAHSDFSIQDSLLRVDDYARRCAELRLPAAALTDHGTLSGVPAFVEAFKAHAPDTVPVIGLEAYTPVGALGDGVSIADRNRPNHHLTLLAASLEGYRSLLALSTESHRPIDDGGGFYGKPRVDASLLEAHNAGLLVLTGCYGGELSARIREGDPEGARRTLTWLRDRFRGRLWVEVQYHADAAGADLYGPITPTAVAMARDLGLPLAVGTDAHYLTPDQADAHRTWQVASRREKVGDDGALVDLHVWTPQEVSARWAALPEAVAGTLEVAERVERYALPHAGGLPELEPGMDDAAYAARLWDWALDGLGKRLQGLPTAYYERLEAEHAVLAEKPGFCQYLLVVEDVIRWARERGMLVLPRGSAVGALTCYALGFTEIDPLKYGIRFERFVTPGRTELPDVDLDVASRDQPLIRGYLRERYGADHVGLLAAVGHLKARGALDKAGIAGRVPPPTVAALKAAIPTGKEEPALADAPDVPAVASALRGSQALRDLYAAALPFDGLVNTQSKHPAGVIVSREPLIGALPLGRPHPEGDFPVVQYDMDAVAKAGFLKLDVLGVEQLTAVRLCLDSLGRTVEALWQLPDGDPATYAMLGRGEGGGVFQMSSPGMRQTLRALQPKSIDDLCAAIALYRPGPMELIPEYARRRAGRAPVKYLHPDLEGPLGPTLGIFVYQDQVLEVLVSCFGYGWDEADAFRKAIGKKIKALLDAELAKLRLRATARGWAPALADQLVHTLEPFARYGFGRAHGVAYAHLSYWTAYLKAHRPVAYFRALLEAHLGRVERTQDLLKEAREAGVHVLPPELGRAAPGWTAEPDPVPGAGSPSEDDAALRVALAGIKGVGLPAAEAVADSVAPAAGGLPATMGAWLWRLQGDATWSQRVDRATIAALFEAGATPPAWGDPNGLLAQLDALRKWAASRKRLPAVDLFTGTDLLPEPEPPGAAEVPPAETSDERAARERERIGLRVRHPLDEWHAWARARKVVTLTCRDADGPAPPPTPPAGHVLAGQVLQRTGAYLTVDDPTGRVRVWHDGLAGRGLAETPGAAVFALLRVQLHRRNVPVRLGRGAEVDHDEAPMAWEAQTSVRLVAPPRFVGLPELREAQAHDRAGYADDHLARMTTPPPSGGPGGPGGPTTPELPMPPIEYVLPGDDSRLELLYELLLGQPGSRRVRVGLTGWGPAARTPFPAPPCWDELGVAWTAQLGAVLGDLFPAEPDATPAEAPTATEDTRA